MLVNGTIGSNNASSHYHIPHMNGILRLWVSITGNTEDVLRSLRVRGHQDILSEASADTKSVPISFLPGCL